MSNARWGVGSNQYRKRPPTTREDSPAPELRRPGAADAFEVTGIRWNIDDVAIERMTGNGDAQRARHRFRSRFPEMIWDAARLEGNTFTLPEVQTLLDGVTVDGHRLEDQNQILALNEGFNRLDERVGSGTFSLSREVSNELHGLVAVHEAIESGHFRGEGSVRGGGSVRLSDGRTVDGRDHGEDGQLVQAAFTDLSDYLSTIDDPRLRALVYAASAIRHQFYFDGNKRTAKLMAGGELMAHGFDAVSIPYSRLYEQNVALDHLFATDDATDLMRLLADSTR